MLASPVFEIAGAPADPSATVSWPAISTAPEKSPVAASSSPVKVTFLNPEISLSESTITASEADTVPAVIPSNKFNAPPVQVTAVPA